MFLRLNGFPTLEPIIEEGLCQLFALLWVERQTRRRRTSPTETPRSAYLAPRRSPTRDIRRWPSPHRRLHRARSSDALRHSQIYPKFPVALASSLVHTHEPRRAAGAAAPPAARQNVPDGHFSPDLVHRISWDVPDVVTHPRADRARVMDALASALNDKMAACAIAADFPAPAPAPGTALLDTKDLDGSDAARALAKLGGVSLTTQLFKKHRRV